MRKLLYSLCLILTFLMLTCTLSSCGSSLSTTNNIHTSPYIEEYVVVTLDRDNAEALGFNVANAKLDIYQQIISIARRLQTNFNSKLLNHLNSGVNGDTKEYLLNMENGVSILTSNWIDNKLKVGLSFKNMDSYNYFYNINNSLNSSRTLENKLFYYKVTEQLETNYYLNHKFLDNVKENIALINYTLITDTTSEIYYTYVTDKSRIHTDANLVETGYGYNYHTWQITENNQSISLFYNVANSGVWIMTCVGISLILTFILTIVAIIINHNKQSRSSS